MFNEKEIKKTSTDAYLYSFQDDLEDCGEVSMNIKIRVMPSCWFILGRYSGLKILAEKDCNTFNCRVFTRVDGALVNIQDTRLYHCFGTDKVFLDISWQRKNITAPACVDSATTTFLSATDAPIGDIRRRSSGRDEPPPHLIRDSNAWSRLLPDVTADEGIHKHFSLVLPSE